MIQARALEPTPDLCCLPSPHRIPQGVAGMAFNFSKIEISHYPTQRKAPLHAKPQRKPDSSSAQRA
jgi:hypothetical protein